MGRYEMMETNISAKMLRKCREGVQYLLVPEWCGPKNTGCPKSLYTPQNVNNFFT